MFATCQLWGYFDNQQLVGIITFQNLMHSMALLAESRKLRRAALES